MNRGFPQFFLRVTTIQKNVQPQILLTVKYLEVVNQTASDLKPIINSYQHPEF